MGEWLRMGSAVRFAPTPLIRKRQCVVNLSL
jgi:hypothetical protein